jgi:hypothetical protein
MTGASPSSWLAEWSKFEAAKQDDYDLAFYFEHRTTRGLTEWQKRRWTSVHRRLDGRCWRLQLYYTRPASLPVPALEQLMADDWWSCAQRRREPSEFIAFANDAWQRLERHALYAGGTKTAADIGDARVTEFVRLNAWCVEMLRTDYEEFLRPVPQAREPSAIVDRAKFGAFLGDQLLAPAHWHGGEQHGERLEAPARVTGPDLIGEWLLADQVELSTWLQIRIEPEAARLALVKGGWSHAEAFTMTDRAA